MHTLQHSGITINHDGDMSGPARIFIPAFAAYDEYPAKVLPDGSVQVWVPAAALAAFSWEAAKAGMIGLVEQLEPPGADR